MLKYLIFIQRGKIKYKYDFFLNILINEKGQEVQKVKARISKEKSRNRIILVVVSSVHNLKRTESTRSKSRIVEGNRRNKIM